MPAYSRLVHTFYKVLILVYGAWFEGIVVMAGFDFCEFSLNVAIFTLDYVGWLEFAKRFRVGFTGCFMGFIFFYLSFTCICKLYLFKLRLWIQKYIVNNKIKIDLANNSY